MKYYIISGEASGDLHASNLVKSIFQKDPEAQIRAWGGDLLSAAGANVVKHYRDLAFMGFVEVLFNLKTIVRNLDFCKKDIQSFNPDCVILVDYPGFNLRIAEFAHKSGYKVFYYISPQIWAWKQSRVNLIQKYVDRMLVILPFEKEFYNRFGYNADFVGHPLLDAINNYPGRDKSFSNSDDQRKIIALLPGSRKQEISDVLPLMLATAKYFKEYRFVIAGAPSMPASFYEKYMKGSDVELIHGRTYDILRNAHAALVTSGTATLETALFNVPQVVCYKANSISYLIARKLIKVKYISLVNLIMDREVVKELIQDELNEVKIKDQFRKVTEEGVFRSKMLEDYRELAGKLGGQGASDRTASIILNDLNCP